MLNSEKIDLDRTLNLHGMKVITAVLKLKLLGSRNANKEVYITIYQVYCKVSTFT